MSTEILEGVYSKNVDSSLLSRVLGMVYAFVAYNIGAGALFWLLLAAGGFVPYGVSNIELQNTTMALLFNASLVLLFAVQHTVMARKNFKAWWTTVIPAHLERATYILASGIATLLVVWYWQALPGLLWNVEHGVATIVIQVLYALGIVYLLGASFITNHFELFGLRQAWLNLRGVAYTPLEFKRRWVYRYSRHPMMLGMLIALWATPEMTATRFTLGVLFTVYMFAGIRFEENDLIKDFGEKYRQYRREVGLFFTF